MTAIPQHRPGIPSKMVPSETCSLAPQGHFRCLRPADLLAFNLLAARSKTSAPLWDTAGLNFGHSSAALVLTASWKKGSVDRSHFWNSSTWRCIVVFPLRLPISPQHHAKPTIDVMRVGSRFLFASIPFYCFWGERRFRILGLKYSKRTLVMPSEGAVEKACPCFQFRHSVDASPTSGERELSIS